MKPRKILWKRIVLLLAGVVVVCGLLALAYYLFQRPILSALRARAWKTDPVAAEETARAMLDFDLPSGYQPEKIPSIQAAAGSAVIIVDQQHPSNLIFISLAPDGIIANEEWRTSYEERGAHEIAGQLYETVTTATQPGTVRGQPTTMRIMEGTDQNGQPVKQLVCMFKGKSGEILLVIVASTDTWDPVMLEDFLASIR